jgi:hypothetical protein
MRTQAEIIERIKTAKKNDLFGFECGDYAGALTKESAESLRGILLKDDADLSDWEQQFKTDEDVRKQCIGYMDFAWEKANNCRGLSAMRTMTHYKAWLWLLGQDGFDDLENYSHYGKDNLVRICKFFDLDPKKWDDGRRVNSESE